MAYSSHDTDIETLWRAVKLLEKRVAELEAAPSVGLKLGPPLEFSAAPGNFEIDDCTCGEINARHCPVHNEAGEP